MLPRSEEWSQKWHEDTWQGGRDLIYIQAAECDRLQTECCLPCHCLYSWFYINDFSDLPSQFLLVSQHDVKYRRLNNFDRSLIHCWSFCCNNLSLEVSEIVVRIETWIMIKKKSSKTEIGTLFYLELIGWMTSNVTSWPHPLWLRGSAQ